jgi:hypothetical protein
VSPDKKGEGKKIIEEENQKRKHEEEKTGRQAGKRQFSMVINVL